MVNQCPGFSGNTSDPIAGSHSLNGMKFSTRDRDNNLSTPPGYSYALQAYGRTGDWWYRYCSYIYPMVNYQYFLNINGHRDPLPFVEIKIRPLNSNY